MLDVSSTPSKNNKKTPQFPSSPSHFPPSSGKSPRFAPLYQAKISPIHPRNTIDYQPNTQKTRKKIIFFEFFVYSADNQLCIADGLVRFLPDIGERSGRIRLTEGKNETGTMGIVEFFCCFWTGMDDTSNKIVLYF